MQTLDAVSNPPLDAKETRSSQEETLDFNALISNSLFRREFKIQGQIGEASQKDKISFISLMRQIREAKAKGYNEKDITSALIRVFTPGLSVRTYLETIFDLKLPPHLHLLLALVISYDWSKVTTAIRTARAISMKK